MRRSPTRLLLLALTLAATLAACDGSTGPEASTPWWEGAWVAVRGNDAPLPFRSDSYGSTVREIVLVLRSDTTQASTFTSSGTFLSVTTNVEDPVSRQVRVTAGADSVRIYDPPTATVGQLDLVFRRRGDTLVLASCRGGAFKLVRPRLQ